MNLTEYYALLFDSCDKKLSTIIDQEIIDTPYDIFQRCAPIDSNARIGLRESSFQTKNVAKLGDYIENAIDWPLCSARFAKLIYSLCPDAVELIDAPRIYDSSGRVELGAKVINILVSHPCLDIEKSTIVRRPNGQIRSVYEKFLRPNHGIPEGTHIFRPTEWPPAILISGQMAKWLCEAKVTGITYEPIGLS